MKKKKSSPGRCVFCLEKLRRTYMGHILDFYVINHEQEGRYSLEGLEC